MALVDCPECGKEVSTLARACPHCGAPVRSQRTSLMPVVNLMIGVVAVVLITVYVQGCQRDLTGLADDFHAIGRDD